MKRPLLLALLLLAGCPTHTEVDQAHFPIRGMHVDLSCADCHAEDLTTPIPPGCNTCHEEDRPSADHYPGQDCGDCHTDAGWDGAMVDHDDFFPTPHEGVSDCVSCHLNTPDNSTFSCIDCHEHRQSKMDAEHRGETNNYRWESNACLECHPDGRE